MGRPDFDDSVAGDADGGESSGYVFLGDDTLGSLTGSADSNLSTVLGTLQESDNGTT